MVQRISIGLLQREQAPKIVGGDALLRHADAPMQLYTLLANETARLRHPRFAGRQPGGGVVFGGNEQRRASNCFGQLQLRIHVYKPVLNGLKLGDSDTELLTQLRVRNRCVKHPLHRTDGDLAMGGQTLPIRILKNTRQIIHL